MVEDAQPSQPPKDQEPPSPKAGAPVEQPKTRQAFARTRRELSEDEMNSPGVQRMLLDDIDRLEREKADLSEYRRRFHETDKECTELRTKRRRGLAADTVFGGCMALGGVILGNLANLQARPDLLWLSGIVGGALLLLGIVAKAIDR